MRTIFRLRSVALVATIAMMGATAFVASGATGAYFSATGNGEVDATFGTIELDTSSTGLDFTLDEILPGETRSVTIGFVNSGGSPQDVYFALGETVAASPAAVAAMNAFVDTSARPLPAWGTVKITRNSDTQVMWNSPYWGAFPASGNLLISSGVPVGGSDSFTIEVVFGTDIGDGMQGEGAIAKYRIVATQVDILPGA